MSEHTPGPDSDIWEKINEETETCILSIVMGYSTGRKSADETMELIYERCLTSYMAGFNNSAVPDLLEACKAAMLALRSYQYGNSAPDLAENIADNCEQAISAATGKE